MMVRMSRVNWKVKTVSDQALPEPPHTMPASAFSRGKAGQAFAEAQRHPVFVYRRSRPIAVIVGIEEYERIRADGLRRTGKE